MNTNANPLESGYQEAEKLMGAKAVHDFRTEQAAAEVAAQDAKIETARDLLASNPKTAERIRRNVELYKQAAAKVDTPNAEIFKARAGRLAAELSNTPTN